MARKLLGELRRGVIKGELAIIYCAFECSCVCVINYRLGTLPLLVSEISLLGPSWRTRSPFPWLPLAASYTNCLLKGEPSIDGTDT